MIHMLNSKCIAFYGLSPHHAPRDDEPNNHYWSYLLHNTRCAAQCTIRTKREMGKSRKFSYCRLCWLSHWFEGVDFSEDFRCWGFTGCNHGFLSSAKSSHQQWVQPSTEVSFNPAMKIWEPRRSPCLTFAFVGGFFTLKVHKQAPEKLLWRLWVDNSWLAKAYFLLSTG